MELRARSFALVASIIVGLFSLIADGSAAPSRLVAADAGGVITVGTDDYPSAGWQLVFDDSRNGSIAEFHLAGVAGGANLCADGSYGPRAGLFEKIWGTERGPHWLSGVFGSVGGESQLVESNAVRARIVQFVQTTDAVSPEVPARLVVRYTVYHTGRIYIDTQWALNDLGVEGTAPYGDNSWRIVLANTDYLAGAVDDSAHAVAFDNGLPGLPALVFAVYPRFWENGATNSIDDPETRAWYFGSGTFDVTSDPFIGIAGSRLGGSWSPANPYVRGDTFRHVFLLDWSQPGPAALESASVVGLDLTHPDPLDGTGDAGRITTGTLITDDAADADHDGFAEGEGCHVISSVADVMSIRYAPIRVTSYGAMQPLRDPVFKITNFLSVHDSLGLMYSIDGGVNWNYLVPGEDYLATTHADEGEIGAHTRLVSVVKTFPVAAAETIWLSYGVLEGQVTATVLHGPEVESRPGEITIGWRCSERGIYRGYHVGRCEAGSVSPAAGSWVRLTASPIPDVSGEDGASYTWIDRTAQDGRTYRYRVEALPVAGGEPVVITAVDPVRAQGLGATLVTSSGTPPSIVASPNPFNPSVSFALSGGADPAARFDILDASGRRVRSLAPGERVSWDGRDDTGRDLSSGIYFARLSTMAGVVTEKVVLMK